MRNHFSNFATAIALFLQGCGGEWPPHYQELSEHHANNITAFEELNQKLRASGYVFAVADDTMRNLPSPVDYQNVSATRAFGTPRETIENTKEWSDLFQQTQLYAIRVDSGTFQGDLRSKLAVDEQSYTAIYVHGGSGTKHKCEANHENIPCGKCYAPLSMNWGIEYLWTDHTIVTSANKRAATGELPWRDVDATVDKEIHECRTQGYAQIGYTYAP